MNIQQFLLILRARWWIAVLVLVLAVAGTALVNVFLPRQYTAVATVLVDVKSPDPIAGMVLPGLMSPGYMATQSDIITSESVAVRVVRKLKLDQNENMRRSWMEDTKGVGSVESWVATLVARKLEAKPARESNVISIIYKAADPVFAATVANAFAEAYIDANIALSVEPARHYSDWFRVRAEELHAGFEKAQQKLSDYNQKHRLITSDERLDAENQKLNELETQYVLAVASNADSSSKRASNGAETLPEVMQSPVVNQLKADISRAESKLEQAGGNLGINHPQYQSAQSELADLREQLATEIRRVSTSVDTVGRISHGKEAELRAKIDEVKHTILDIKKARSEVDVLRQDVETAQKAYETVSQRANQTNLSSQSTQTNISILSPADPPGQPSSPRVQLNILLSIFLGTLLGIGAALALELSDRRLRSRDDVVQVFPFPVLAELSSR